MNAATSMMPELGSKISLISKADIRYEGRLYTVDPQECTIALANVRSFGTEDRETLYPIAPQPTVYDYILFRGSDIKDIRVVNNVPIPNDPAIMQLQMPQQPPQQSFPQNFPLQQQPGGGFGPFGQINQQGPPQSGANIGGLPIVGQNITQQPPQQQQQAQSLSPNQLQQTPANQQQQQQGNKINNNLTSVGGGQTKKSSELSKVEKTSQEKSTSVQTPNTTQTSANRKQSHKSQDSRSGTPNARKSPISDMGVQTNQQRDQNAGGNKERYQRNNQRNNNNNQQQQHRERRDSGRNEIQNERREGGGGGYRNQNQQRGPQMQRGGGGGYNNNHRNNNQMRQGNQGSGRMRAPPQFFRQNQNKMMQQNGQQRGNKNQNTLKFDNEFDFEQANSKFEELRSQFTKLKVGSDENKQAPEQQVNGETEKKDDSGNETGADHEAEPEDVSGYDKNKSFFDNISCEAVERSKGKPQRPDWRQERKINSETFGYSTNRRGNMRGRNYYRPTYNRQMNNYRSGGPQQQNRNYNNRNRNNNSGRNNNNQVQTPQNQQQPVAATN